MLSVGSLVEYSSYLVHVEKIRQFYSLSAELLSVTSMKTLRLTILLQCCTGHSMMFNAHDKHVIRCPQGRNIISKFLALQIKHFLFPFISDINCVFI